MVAWRLAASAVLLLSVSCTSIFDSYYPDSLEYLETQTNVKQEVGGKTIVSLHMQILQKNIVHKKDLLAVVVDTDDGKQTVLFYDDGLKLVKSFSQSSLTAVNGGVVPDLFPISQDSVYLHTGEIWYDPSGSGGRPTLIGSQALPDFLQPTLSSGGLSRIQQTYYEDTVSGIAFTAFFIPGSNSVVTPPTPVSAYTSLLDFNPTGGLSPLNPVGSIGGPMLLAATCWNQTFYMMVSSNGTAYMATLSSSDPNDWSGAYVAAAKPKGSEGMDLNDGWATSRAGILRTHSDNASLLRAFSWAGKDLGTIRVDSNSNDVAFAFHPEGTYWYVFDPVTGRISRYKAWW